MARAKLHIICGNCGSNDEFSYHIEDASDGETERTAVYISCDNCATLHALDDTIKERK